MKSRVGTPIGAILFDKDGTVLDYWKTWLPINRDVALFAAGGDRRLADELLVAAGHDPVTDRVRSGSPLAAGPASEIADSFADHMGIKCTPELVTGVERLFAEGGARTAVAIEGARDVIEALKARGLVCGLATNDTTAGMEASLKRAGLDDLFQFLVASDSGHGAKPEPGMALAFAASVGMPVGQIAVVGDSRHDLDMARRAHCGLAIAVLSGPSPRADLAGHADIVLDSVRDLVGLL